MSSEKEIILRVDTQKKIGIEDVIDMLKGLREETIFEIVRTSEQNIDKDHYEKMTSLKNDDIKIKSNLVTGNTDLPQIRELNEIAALLRSMDNEQSTFET